MTGETNVTGVLDAGALERMTLEAMTAGANRGKQVDLRLVPDGIVVRVTGKGSGEQWDFGYSQIVIWKRLQGTYDPASLVLAAVEESIEKVEWKLTTER